MIRAVLFAAAACGVFFFCVPLRYGSVNFGNMIGLILSGLLFAYGFFFRTVNRFAAAWFADPVGRVVLILLGILCLCVLTLMTVEGVLMARACKVPPAAGATLVVLGCRVRKETPTLMLRERLDAACAKLTEDPSCSAVLSGGMGKDEEMTEASAMFCYLTARGITPERLYLEDRSVTTRENLRFSLALIREKGLNPKLAVVTNEFHEYRALMLAKDAGALAGAVPARTAWWLFPTYAFRELMAIWNEWMKRRAGGLQSQD